jgi:Mrp family chromosome partitioning ATPase/predicted Fe-Mo cluster-binding NifX family protein
MTDRDNTCESCENSSCSAKAQKDGERREDFIERQAIARRLCQITHKVLILSGKGGVGKSTVAVNLALTLAQEDKKVGLMDIDIHGPSIPHLLHLEGTPVQGSKEGIEPIRFNENLSVISIGFFLRQRDDAVIWRGPMKFGMIKQFIKDVEWGDLDYLIVDSPPGTGDEPLSIAQMMNEGASAIIVTTPQELAINDVRKCITFCRKVNVPVLGVIENMSGFVCPHCHTAVNIFKKDGGVHMARNMGVPFLGSIPIDPEIVEASDTGRPYVYAYSESETAQAFRTAIKPILTMDAIVEEVTGHEQSGEQKDLVKTSETGKGADTENTPNTAKQGEADMIIAIPVVAGKLSRHFGHCEEFVLFHVDTTTKRIVKKESHRAPEHEPGLLPRWLHEKGATTIIAGGMGQRAQGLFAANGISVEVGAEAGDPEDIVTAYLAGTLTIGDNICDH